MTNLTAFCIIYGTYGKIFFYRGDLMKPIDKFKQIRNDYVIRQVEKAKLPAFEDDRFVRRHMVFSGRVQHVGFRLEIAQLAKRLALTGWVKNLENGDVEAEFQGFESRIRFLLKFMRSLKRIKIKRLENKPHSLQQGETDFLIL